MELWALLVQIAAFVAVVLSLHLTLRTTKRKTKTLTIRSLDLRVDYIPVSLVDDLEPTLHSIIKITPVLEDAVTALICRSAVRNSRGSFCATVIVRTILSPEDLITNLRNAGKDYPLTYSCNFEGITVLHDETDDNGVDVIVVPDLRSHTLGCWKSINSDDVWLRDALPRDISNIRVLLYGHDKNFSHSLSQESVENLAGALIGKVMAFRAEDGTCRRPVVFIAHTMGIVIVKEALVQAKNNTVASNLQFFTVCYGLLFFGVPNLSSSKSPVQAATRFQMHEKLVYGNLDENNPEPTESLKRFEDNFARCCKHHCSIVTFMESTPNSVMKHTRKDAFLSCKVSERVVRSTAVNENSIALNTSYSKLGKFESRHYSNYVTVRKQIASQVDKAKTKVYRRLLENRVDQYSLEATQACLHALAFKGMHNSLVNTVGDAKDSFFWLSKQANYIYWKDQHRSLLSITGEPGSGKSTLMRYTMKELATRYGPNTQVFGFFFQETKNEVQKTTIGLFRTLLHQILTSIPGAACGLVDEFYATLMRINKSEENWEWRLQYLQKHFESALLKVLTRFSVIVLVDALDEYSQNPSELLEYLRLLLARCAGDLCSFRICVSFRLSQNLISTGGLTVEMNPTWAHETSAKVIRVDGLKGADHTAQVIAIKEGQSGNVKNLEAKEFSVQIVGDPEVCALGVELVTATWEKKITEENAPNHAFGSTDSFVNGSITATCVVAGQQTSGGATNFNFNCR